MRTMAKDVLTEFETMKLIYIDFMEENNKRRCQQCPTCLLNQIQWGSGYCFHCYRTFAFQQCRRRRLCQSNLVPHSFQFPIEWVLRRWFACNVIVVELLFISLDSWRFYLSSVLHSFGNSLLCSFCGAHCLRSKFKMDLVSYFPCISG